MTEAVVVENNNRGVNCSIGSAAKATVKGVDTFYRIVERSTGEVRKVYSMVF